MRILFVALLSLLLAACGGTETSSKDLFIVYGFKVGKADNLLLEQNGEYLLIYTGEEDDGQEIIEYLQSHQITTLKALFITHYDKDHVGGADYIVNAVNIEHIYVPNYESNSKQNKFLNAVAKANLTLEKLTANTPISIGQATGTIYPPIPFNYDGDNDYSLVVSMHYDETSLLFAEDVEETRIADMLADPSINLTHTFLKVPHHGRFNEKTEALFEAVHPQYALITSSDKNPEADETVAALKAIDSKIYTTRSGDVEFISDGSSISVNE